MVSLANGVSLLQFFIAAPGAKLWAHGDIQLQVSSALFGIEKDKSFMGA